MSVIKHPGYPLAGERWRYLAWDRENGGVVLEIRRVGRTPKREQESVSFLVRSRLPLAKPWRVWSLAGWFESYKRGELTLIPEATP